MEGYAAYLANVGDSKPVAYWNGYVFSEVIDDTKIFPTRADVKTSTAQLISQYADQDIIYVPARQTVVLGTPGTVLDSVPPSNSPSAAAIQGNNTTTIQSA